MNAERAAFLDQLTEAIDAGDRRAAGILPMFRHWLIELAQDPEAAKHEPGSAGYTARMFALRELDEAAEQHGVTPRTLPCPRERLDARQPHALTSR